MRHKINGSCKRITWKNLRLCYTSSKNRCCGSRYYTLLRYTRLLGTLLSTWKTALHLLCTTSRRRLRLNPTSIKLRLTKDSKVVLLLTALNHSSSSIFIRHYPVSSRKHLQLLTDAQTGLIPDMEWLKQQVERENKTPASTGAEWTR